jgi:hypothetical protein
MEALRCAPALATRAAPPRCTARPRALHRAAAAPAAARLHRARAARPPRRAAALSVAASADAPEEKSAAAPSSRGVSMAQIKSFGVAGTISYVLTELAFWAVAAPGAWFGYHATTGVWLSWDTDRAQLAALAAAFVTGVRFAVPLRMGVALACVPLVQRALGKADSAGDA